MILRLILLWLMLNLVAPTARAFVQTTLPPEPTTAPIALVAQGSLLAISAPAGVTTLTFLGGNYRRATTHPLYDFVIPVGMRQDTGAYVLQANNGAQWNIHCVPGGWPEQVITLPTDEKVNLSEADLARVDRENSRIGSLFALRTDRPTPLSFVHPLVGDPPGSRFGSRRIINGVAKQRHTGADYSAPLGTKVRASEAGTVVLAEEHFFAGKSIFIDHGDGWISMYFHLDSMAVRKGQAVARAQNIGTVGASGRATGPHLHFGFRYQGAIVDPADVFELFRQATQINGQKEK